jgi:cytochrome c
MAMIGRLAPQPGNHFSFARSKKVASGKQAFRPCEVPLSMPENVRYGPQGCGKNKLFRGHTNMKRNFLMGAAALASLATLSACGGAADDKAAAPAAGETTAAAPAPAAEAPAAEPAATMEFASMTTDVAAGEKVFALCRSCHVLEEGVNRVGPSLYNIVGRASGSVAGYSYSDANKTSGVTWTTDVLFKYLEDPKGFMPGTKMAFPGIKDAQDRANLVAYLESTKK